MNYQIHSLNEKDIESIAELYLLAFKREPNLDLFKWKYFNTPFGNATLAGIYTDNVLVGCGAIVPEKMNVFGKTKTVYKYMDFMVHPLHRRKGLITMIINSLISNTSCHEETIIRYMFCTETVTQAFKKYNHLKLASIQNYFKPRTMLLLGSFFNNTKKLYAKGILQKFDSIPDRLNTFPFNISKNKIGIIKSISYLKWRMENPKFNYKIICYLEKNKVIGYIITGIGKYNMLNIIDFEVLNNNQNVLKSILKSAEYEATINNCKAMIGITKDNSTWSNLFRKNNFLINPFNKGPLKSILDFNVQENKGAPKFMKKENWEINALNYEDI